MHVKISDYIVGIVIFTIIIASGILFILGFSQSDPSMTSNQAFTDFNTTFNIEDSVQTDIGDLQDSVNNSGTDWGIFGVLNSLISTSWQTLRTMKKTLSFMDNVYLGMAGQFQVPKNIIRLFMLLVVILIIFAIFSAIFQKEI